MLRALDLLRAVLGRVVPIAEGELVVRVDFASAQSLPFLKPA